MDVEVSEIIPGASLPNEDNVYRIVINTDRDKKNKAIPAIRCFSLSENDKFKLSVDWDRLTTPEDVIAREGGRFKFGTEEYKPYANRELYSIRVDFLRSIESIIDVIHDPIINNPEKKGEPNNVAHSLVCFLENKEEEPYVFQKIRDFAKENKINFNIEEVDKKVTILRQKHEVTSPESGVSD